jgi:hypothetical protein
LAVNKLKSANKVLELVFWQHLPLQQ